MPRCPYCGKRLDEVYFNRSEMEAGEPRYYECQEHGRISREEAEEQHRYLKKEKSKRRR